MVRDYYYLLLKTLLSYPVSPVVSQAPGAIRVGPHSQAMVFGSRSDNKINGPNTAPLPHGQAGMCFQDGVLLCFPFCS